MLDELVVILLGAEASVLIFITAATLRAKRMDVLSGRFFEQAATSPADNPPLSVRDYARDLLRRARTRGRYGQDHSAISHSGSA